ncbi:hypothetical protein FRC03_012563 [Tulasnella sp. 419]|nr:hypothetical protein FRC03_012563 [Tulasnella sp. 419]
MASATTARSSTPLSRRSANSPASPPTGTIPRTTVSARSAVSPRVAQGPLSSHARRGSRASLPLNTLNSDKEVAGASRETLEALLKQEQDEKEQLLLKTQNHEQTIVNSVKEVETLTSHLKAAESRLAELDADQERMEKEAAEKDQVIDLLRGQIKELEREKRELRKRYEDQTSTFEAERQAFYTEQQHLKSRIQALSQARRRSPRRPRSPSVAPNQGNEDEAEDSEAEDEGAGETKDNEGDGGKAEEDNEPAEMTALRLELSTLSVSHTSLQNTLHLLQNQLMDVELVNSRLQEDNESYALLLQEKTLSGQFDIRGVLNDADSFNDEDEGRTPRSRHTLDVVPEADESQAVAVNKVLSAVDRDSSPASRHSNRSSARSRRGVPRGVSPPRGAGESLGDLPITGPGLDLAAELGRAENKDISEGRIDPKPQPQVQNESDDLRALRTEVKALKDANKALSLYASKILERIIAQEGFEHVLAVDYDKPRQESAKPKPAPPPPERKPRPTSFFLPLRSSTTPVNTTPAPPLTRTSSDPAPDATPASAAMTPTASAPVPSTASAASTSAEIAAEKRTRRGYSVDWKGITSLFGGGSQQPAEAKNEKLRPLTLKASAPMTNSPTSAARKIETVEDEEDRRERDRLAATMKLMGIEKPVDATPPLISDPTPSTVASPPPSARVSLFTRFRSSDSVPPTPSPLTTPPQHHLTTEALEQAEVESSLAALDAQEKVLSEQYAKGGGSAFTELGNRSSLSSSYKKHRSARSGSGKNRFSDDNSDAHSRSGSVNTIFSAGTMNGDVVDDTAKA